MLHRMMTLTAALLGAALLVTLVALLVVLLRRPPGLQTSGATGKSPFLEKRVPAFIPSHYINDTTLRIQAYRHVAEITTARQLEQLRKDWRDRFGKFPEAVENLFLLGAIKLAAATAGITRAEVKEDKIMLTRGGDFILVGGKFPRLVAGSIEQHLREILELIQKL